MSAEGAFTVPAISRETVGCLTPEPSATSETVSPSALTNRSNSVRGSPVYRLPRAMGSHYARVNDWAQGDSAASCDPMKDKLDGLRHFLWQEARRRRHWMRANGQPNGSAIARDLGCSQPTVSRILAGKRPSSPQAPKRPLRSYQPEADLEEKLQVYFGFRHLGDLWDAVENAEGAAPPPPRPKGRN